MSAYYDDGAVQLFHGDCLDVLPGLPDGSVDSVVTDPPYSLGFMGRTWDATGVAFHPETWAAVLRVLKPGGHLVAFGGTRTYHRLTCAIEDAGFEIRDSIGLLGWTYSQGFPKSLNVSKALDKAARAERQVVGVSPHSRNRQASSYQADDSAAHGYVGHAEGARLLSAPATDAARQWQGFGTALKPGWEPVVLARKPLAGTVAANVLAHGTGALNVDWCRVAMSDADRDTINGMGGFGSASWTGPADGGPQRSTFDAAERSGSLPAVDANAHALGRWPTNLLLTHHPDCTDVCQPDCHVAELDRQSGTLTSGAWTGKRNGSKFGHLYGEFAGTESAETPREASTGGASRFFPVFRYEPKAPTSERPLADDGTGHPTVKPLALMRWLARLVTPPGGLVLDPFAGSGTTGEACVIEGFRAVLIEQDPDSLTRIRNRLSKPIQPDIFGGVA